MVRPREFDVDEALDRALDVLWTRGYEATSIDDLCAATGLSRSSLYAAYGGKRDLLLKAVDRYVDQRTPVIAASLARPVPIRDAFADFLQEIIEQILTGTGRRGCFLGNCAAELSRGDRGAMTRVRAGLQRTEATFRDALAGAEARGELSRGTDVESLARFLTAGVQGLRLIGKANPERAVLEDVARTMLRCLDPT
jgi:TetR/AcrR family transcriptional regulator, transcriptional repressor for nem operon